MFFFDRELEENVLNWIIECEKIICEYLHILSMFFFKYAYFTINQLYYFSEELKNMKITNIYKSNFYDTNICEEGFEACLNNKPEFYVFLVYIFYILYIFLAINILLKFFILVFECIYDIYKFSSSYFIISLLFNFTIFYFFILYKDLFLFPNKFYLYLLVYNFFLFLIFMAYKTTKVCCCKCRVLKKIKEIEI